MDDAGAGPMRVDASVSMSQGGSNQFWLEMWNGRFHGPRRGMTILRSIRVATRPIAGLRSTTASLSARAWMRLKPGWETT